jgi:hypothetical protein
MRLPDGEVHKEDNWVLKEKNKVFGKGFMGQDVETKMATFVCEKCQGSYTRFIKNNKEYEDLQVGFNRWKWGWDKSK